MKFSGSLLFTLFGFRLAQGAVFRRGYGDDHKYVSGGYGATDKPSVHHGSYNVAQDNYSGSGSLDYNNSFEGNTEGKIKQKIRDSRRNRGKHGSRSVNANVSVGRKYSHGKRGVNASVRADSQSSRSNRGVHAKIDVGRQSSRGY